MLLARALRAAPQSRAFAAAAAAPAAALPSRFSGTPLGPPDAILGVTEAFKADPSPTKINLGVGAYRDAAGRPYVLPSVREAQRRIDARDENMEYLPVAGLAAFNDKAVRLAYGDANPLVAAGCVAALQALSGTGACRIGGELIARFLDTDAGAGVGASGKPLILVPNPTWSNHHAIFRDAGCDVATYAYYDPKTKGVDIDACLADLAKAPPGATVLLHATAHNPTGCDPTMDEWRAISDVIKNSRLQAFFDSAYQGFTSGDAEKDAASIRLFADEGHKLMLAQSFSKNMGLYGHRVGCFSVLTDSSEEATAVSSQLKIIARAMWSNPPLAGVRIVDEVLGNAELEPQWRTEMKGMADRIMTMREGLKSELNRLESPHCWDHIVKQNGMFTFSGLSPKAVEALAKDHSVYLTSNGRISMAGVYDNNIEYLANAIHAVSKAGL